MVNIVLENEGYIAAIDNELVNLANMEKDHHLESLQMRCGRVAESLRHINISLEKKIKRDTTGLKEEVVSLKAEIVNLKAKLYDCEHRNENT